MISIDVFLVFFLSGLNCGPIAAVAGAILTDTFTAVVCVSSVPNGEINIYKPNNCILMLLVAAVVYCSVTYDRSETVKPAWTE